MAESIKVKYFDPAGRAKEGYLINNKTYKDPDGTQRVDLGSVVETADGSFTLTKNGGVRNDILDNYYKKASDSILNSKKEAESAINYSYNMKENQIADYKSKAKKDYNEAASRENMKKTVSKKNLAQLLKAQGINGGVGESMTIADNIAFEENINELGRDLNRTLWDYDNQLLSFRNEADYNIVKSNEQYDKMYADFLMESAKVKNNDLVAERQLNSENYRFIQSYDRGVYEDERDFATEKERDERDFNRSVYEDERDYQFEFDTDKRDYDRGVFESDRQYDRDVYEDDRDYNRSVYEDDRDYSRDVYEDERDYARGVYEDDRDYNRDVYEDNRDYSRGVYESDRSYNLSASKAAKSSKSSKSDDEYKKDLESAKALAKIGDYSAYAKLFGWTKKQQEKAEREFYLK